MFTWVTAWKLLSDVEETLGMILINTPAEGLTPAEVHVLAELYFKNGRCASDLARSIGREATAFTPILDSLEHKGLVHRQPDPKDRRAVRILLTIKGGQLRETIKAAMDEIDCTYPELTELSSEESAVAAV